MLRRASPCLRFDAPTTFGPWGDVMMHFVVAAGGRRLLRRWVRLVLIMIAALCVATSSRGQTTPEPAVSFSGFNAYGTGDYTVGWSFTVSQPVAVSSLGYLDF